MSSSSLKRKLIDQNEKQTMSSRSEILNRKLSRRPDRDQLIEQGILHQSQCAPSLQDAEHRLKRARLQDKLNNRLLNRPGPLDLVQDHILHLDSNENRSQLEQAIQDGQIYFQTNRRKSSCRRPLIFHEYTSSPSLCKAKVTKFDKVCSTPSDGHQIRLAQQELLLELISDQWKTKTNEIDQRTSETLNVNVSLSSGLIDCQENGDVEIEKESFGRDENEQLDLFSPSELDEILRSFGPTMFIEDKEKDYLSQLKIDFDPLIEYRSEEKNDDDDLFIDILLDEGDPLSSTDQHFYSNRSKFVQNKSVSSILPRITTIDEFDAFLRDFTRNISSNPNSMSTNDQFS